MDAVLCERLLDHGVGPAPDDELVTTIVKMMRAVGDVVPLDWRLIVNGYLPEYAFARGALDVSLPMSVLREAAHIDGRARETGLSPDFSRLIRVDVPSPRLGY